MKAELKQFIRRICHFTLSKPVRYIGKRPMLKKHLMNACNKIPFLSKQLYRLVNITTIQSPYLSEKNKALSPNADYIYNQLKFCLQKNKKNNQQ